jgi:hypothetical protein
LVEPEVWPSLSISHLSCSSVCWTVWCWAACWWEIWNEFAPGKFERSSPHLSLYLFLFDKENRKGGNKDSTGLNIGEFKSLLTQGTWRECGASNFFLLLLLLFYLYFVFFCHGKLGMVGNWNSNNSKSMDPNMFANFYFVIIFLRDTFISKSFFHCSPNFYLFSIAHTRLRWNNTNMNKGAFHNILTVNLKTW